MDVKIRQVISSNGLFDIPRYKFVRYWVMVNGKLADSLTTLKYARVRAKELGAVGKVEYEKSPFEHWYKGMKLG